MRLPPSTRIIKKFGRSLNGRCVPCMTYTSFHDNLQRRWSSRAVPSQRRGHLTQIAHESVGAVLRHGDFAVDATAGNGYDTVFLANRVGPTGRVIAMDIQLRAIEATGGWIRESDCEEQVKLIQRCHSFLHEYLPTDDVNCIRAVMFNLGFLPGSDDKQIVTQPKTTIAALTTCLERLSHGGMVSVMAYRGHPGGQDEADSVADFLGGLLPEQYNVQKHEAPGSGPHLWLVQSI